MDKTPEFAIQRDMRAIYKEMYKRFPGGFPEILVFKDLPDDQSILYRPLPDGRVIYFVKDGTDEEIVNRISEEMLNPECDKDASIPLCYHALEDAEVATWCMYACYITDMLGVSLKQIVFCHDEDAAGYSEKFVTFINDDVSVVEMLMVIAHEERHAWQHRNHPEWFENYIHPEESEEEYYNQISEIDAEAFGIKVESIVTGVDFLESAAAYEMPPQYRDKLKKRVQEIDVILSKKTVNHIRKMIDLDGLLNSV